MCPYIVMISDQNFIFCNSPLTPFAFCIRDYFTSSYQLALLDLYRIVFFI